MCDVLKKELYRKLLNFAKFLVEQNVCDVGMVNFFFEKAKFQMCRYNTKMVRRNVNYLCFHHLATFVHAGLETFDQVFVYCLQLIQHVVHL